MRTLRLVAGLGLWLSLSASAVAFQNEPEGFGGIAWGTSFAAVQKQMRPSGHTSGGYVRATDDLNFGNAALDRINYFLRDGAFDSMVLVAKPNRADGFLLLDALHSSFGSRP